MDKWTFGTSGNVHSFDSEEQLLNHIGQLLDKILTGTELDHIAIRKGKATYELVFDVRLEKK